MAGEVFISYRSTDASEAKMVREYLEKNGIGCWMAPGSIPNGSDYTREIPMGIGACKIFLLLLSAEAQTSPWVHKEVALAISKGKRVFPFIISKCDLTEAYEYMLVNEQCWNAYENMNENLADLVSKIKDALGVVRTGAKVIKTVGQEISYIPMDLDHIEYILQEDGAVINRYYKDFEIEGEKYNPSSLEFPDKIMGVRVKAIDGGVYWFGKYVVNVKIPDGIVRLGSILVGDSNNLRTLEIPRSVTEIEEPFFWDLDTLETAKIEILTPKGSYAETYAKRNGIKYRNI